MYGQGLRVKSAEQVIQEVSTAVEKFGVKTGYFIDLEFLASRDKVIELLDFLVKKAYDFKWCCQTRPDSLDKETVGKMMQAGCRIIHIGAESGVQRLLDGMGKKLSVGEISSAVSMCREVGIRTLVFFLFGMPGETEEDREDVLEFAKKLNADFVSFHRVEPYEGNSIFPTANRGNPEIDRFVRKAYLRYYLRTSYIQRLDYHAAKAGARLFLSRIRTLS